MSGGRIHPNSDVVPFNNIITNLGSHFNTATSKFTCPIRGVYGFWFTIFTDEISSKDSRRPETIGALKIDSADVAVFHCHNYGSSDVEMMCTNSAVSQCDKGSQVWVGINSNSQIYGGRETTFSGFLINAL